MLPFSLHLPDGGKVTGHSLIPEHTRLQPRGAPLVIGLHGGSYNSTYFDAYANTETEPIAFQLGIPFISVNRPRYAGSTSFPSDTLGEDDIAQQGHYLAKTVLPAVWEHYRSESGASSVVLFSHSIGSAVAITTAAMHDPKRLPLTGIVLSGIGVESYGMSKEEMEAARPLFEEGLKTGLLVHEHNHKMESMLRLSEGLSDPTPKLNYDNIHGTSPIGEIISIQRSWREYWPKHAAMVEVPVLYGLAGRDNFWSPEPNEAHPDKTKDFADAFKKSNFVEARVWEKAPHCMEHSHLGRAWMIRCYSFALECAARAQL